MPAPLHGSVRIFSVQRFGQRRAAQSTRHIVLMQAPYGREMIEEARTDRLRQHRDAVFELLTSQAVLDEASRGNTEAATRRMSYLAKIPVLSVSDEVIRFAERLVEMGVVPAKVRSDGVHIAAAAVYSVAYLLTWNCAHIANAAVRVKIEDACRAAGLQAPIICTPEELMEG